MMDPALVDKIAAGEVVRGPFSILKELVENALDAGGSSIEVELEGGGVDSLIVRDNGSGISREDLPLALTRSASSKIQKAADLFELSSFGFRGEALAAISAVSKTQIYSKVAEQVGGKVQLMPQTDGSAKVLCQDWNSPLASSGTVVEVKGLFENVPARRKFLRSPRAEFLACKELLQAIAMSRPDVSFSLAHNQKPVFSVSAFVGNELISRSVFGEEVLRQRASELFPSRAEKQWGEFLYLDCRSPYGTFEALLSPPGYEKATSRHMRFYVNGRVVQDKMIRAAVMRGYHSHLLQSRYPQVIIFVTVDPALVDANVHPAKQEVKFQFASQIQETLSKEIRALIRSGGWTGGTSFNRLHQPNAASLAPQQSSLQAQSTQLEAVRPGMSASFMSGVAAESSALSGAYSFSRPGAYAKKQSPLRFHDLMRAKSQVEEEAEQEARFEGTKPKDAPSDTVSWQQLTYLGCFHKCYLMFESTSGLLVVDQHAFHERILYEQLLQKDKPLGESQPHLIPAPLGLDTEDAAVFKQLIPHIEPLGFGFDVSGSDISLRASPELLQKKDLMVLFHDLLAEVHAGKISQESLAQENGAEAGYLHTLYATFACHSAVRSGEELTLEDITQLLVQAETVDFSSNCPHGRRVFKWYSPGQVGSWFDR